MHIETKGKIARFITSLSCILFGMLIILNMENIKTALVNEVIPFVYLHMSKESAEISNINSTFSTILTEQNEVVDVVLFKFVRVKDHEQTTYTGQIGITALNRNGKANVIETQYGVGEQKKIMQEILLNKVHYENITSIRSECYDFYNAQNSFSCERAPHVNIAYRTIITIPISDKDGYSVIGYILLTLNREYDNKQIARVVSDIRPHVAGVQESMLNF